MEAVQTERTATLHIQVILWAYLIAFLVIYLVLYRLIGGPFTAPAHWFGHKTNSVFDLWAIQHVLAGILIAWCHRGYRRGINDSSWPLESLLYTTLFLALAWEGHEGWAEIGGRGTAIAFWKDGVEHWANRCIADPACVIIGALIFRAFPRTAKPALVLTILWTGANVCMPTCMTIQNLLFTFFFS